MSIDFLRKINIEEEVVEEPVAQAAAASFQSEELFFFKYIRILVYVLVFLVPLFFLPWTSEILDFNKQLLIFAFSGAGLLLYLAQVVRTGRLIVRKTPLNYAVLVFLAAVLAVSIFSDLKYQSVFGGFGAGFYQSLVTTASFAVFFFVVFNVFGFSGSSVKKDAEKLLGLFGLSLSLALLLGVLQILGLPVFKIFGIEGVSFNTIGTVNSLGIAAALVLTLFISKIDFEGEIFRYIRLPAVFLSLFVLLLLNWWVLWVVTISGLVFVLVSNSMSDWRISNYFWPSTVVLLAAVSMLLNLNLAGVVGAGNLPLEIAPSFGTSFDIMKETIRDDPLFGVGPENFSLAYDAYKPQSINNTIFWNIRFSEATSEAFNSAVSLGIVGLAGFLFLLWNAARTGLKNYALFSPFAVLIAAWALYPFNLTLGFAFWLLLGVLALSASRGEDELVINLEKSPRHSLITSVSFVGVMVLAVVSFYFMSLRYAANIKFAMALTESDVDKQTQELVDAINLNRSEDLYSRNLASLLVVRVNQELQKLSGVRNDAERQEVVARVQNFSTTAINLVNEITVRHGRDATNWFSRALVYENLINVIDGADQWAARMYQEYSGLAPNDPTPHLRTGNIQLNRADFLRQLISGQGENLGAQDRANIQNQISENLRLAEESFQKAIELKSDYVLAIYSLGVVYEREGRVKDAVRQLEITRSAEPLDPNVAFQLGLLYYRDNLKEQSFNELQRAVTIFPDFSNARWYLALLYEERGDLDAALRELYRVEELNPENEVLAQKIEELEQGRRSIPPERVVGIEPL